MRSCCGSFSRGMPTSPSGRSSLRRSMSVTAGCSTSCSGSRPRRHLLSHPKLGASWEGFVIEHVLAAEPFDEAWFWATHEGAEIDLLLRRGDRLLGVEYKRADAPKLTSSIRIALRDLGLDRVAVVYPGAQRYPLGESVEAVPLTALATPGSLSTERSSPNEIHPPQSVSTAPARRRRRAASKACRSTNPATDGSSPGFGHAGRRKWRPSPSTVSSRSANATAPRSGSGAGVMAGPGTAGTCRTGSPAWSRPA